MIPLLPALILLLLNGPAGLDPQRGGDLPEALKALQRRCQRPLDVADAHRFESDLVMASLIAAQGDEELGKVVQELLQLMGDTAPAEQIQFASESPEAGSLPPWPDLPRRTQSGHGTSQRTRDGPFAG